ncbi:MAG TPA: hypothetical protein VMT62_05180 [Syntrophorhabdaceae bacterium]|nr:hypothetical protein [Syntrophorhabdaceae bacterium]
MPVKTRLEQGIATLFGTSKIMNRVIEFVNNKFNEEFERLMNLSLNR